MEGNLWQTWTEISIEDGGALGRAAEERSIYKTGRVQTETECFVYLGEAVCGDGGTETEIRRRQAGARKVVV